jgi:hypothetical protein
MLLAEGTHIAADDLRLGDSTAVTRLTPRAASVVKIPPTGIPLEEVERLALIEALKMSNWVQKDAAELLSISPRVMNYKIKTLGIDFPRAGARRCSSSIRHRGRTRSRRFRTSVASSGRRTSEMGTQSGQAGSGFGPYSSARDVCRVRCASVARGCAWR